ncbi:MAG: helix-turn-helix domain-containing protein, partial [Pseudonocardiaceae bacterium]
VPRALIDSCDAQGLPLVALIREVRFAAVIQEVGERIVAGQLAELRDAQRVHETFTELSIAEAGPDAILEAIQRLSGGAVVLETEQHQVLDYLSGPGSIAEFLADWSARSRLVEIETRSTWDEANGWLLTWIGKRDRGWGRLVVQLAEPPSQAMVAAIERAAAALALHRLHDRQRDSALRRTHHELVLGLMADPTSEDLLRRCALAGLPTERRQLVGLTLRSRTADLSPSTHTVRLDEVIAATVHAAHESRLPALVCEMDRDVRALVSVPLSTDSRRAIEKMAGRIHQRHAVVIGAGRPALGPAAIGRTLREAYHVFQSVHGRDRTSGRAVHWLEDVHLRGLLAMLGDDERLRMFADRELDVLQGQDGGDDRLIDAVRALLRHPTSKSQAAASLHVSRPVFYDRIAKAARLLDADLDDPEIRVSLQVALMVDDLAATD